MLFAGHQEEIRPLNTIFVNLALQTAVLYSDEKHVWTQWNTMDLPLKQEHKNSLSGTQLK